MGNDREHIRSKIQALLQLGKSITEVSRIVGVDRKTVRLWKTRGDGNVKDRVRTGRPTKCNAAIKRRIKIISANKIGRGTRTVTKILNQSPEMKQRGETVSRRTVQRCIKNTEWGKYAYRQPIKPLITPKNIKDRLNFCRRLKNEGFLEDNICSRVRRANILFTYECPIELFGVCNRNNAIVRTNNPSLIKPNQKPKFGLKLMVAGGISSRGKTKLHFIEQGATVDSRYYIEKILPIYREYLNDCKFFPIQKSAILMQDGARCHTSKLSMKWIIKNIRNVWTDWPGNSPDLNPIENCWAYLKEKVYAEPRARTRDQLIQKAQQEWDNIPIDFVQKLCESFWSRVSDCLDVEGSHTKY